MTEYTVCIVDDDGAVRLSLGALLKTAGFAVEAYASAEVFLDAGDPSRFDCVLCDVQMPGIDGLELQRRLNANGAGPPVILLTGFGDVPMAVTAMKAGAVDFIEKPYSEDALLDGIRRALESREYERLKDAQVRDSAAGVASLTPREREVFEHLIGGRSNKDIGRALGISPRTVEVFRARVMEKTQSRSVADLVRKALALGIDPERR